MSTDGNTSAAADADAAAASSGASASSAGVTVTAATKPALIARPPLDVYKKIAIIRTGTDEVVYQDAATGSLKKIADLAKASTSTAPSLPKTKKSDIPTPNITLVPDYTRNVPANYQVPTSFVRHVPKSATELESTVEYNVDIEDEHWWLDNTMFGPRAGWVTKKDGDDNDGNNDDGEEDNNNGGVGSGKVGKGGDVAVKMEEDEAGGTTASAAGSRANTPPPAALTSKQLRKGLTLMPQRSRVKLYPPPPDQPPSPTLPLHHFERMLDILETATGFETIITQGEAERLILAKIPVLGRIFAIRKKRGSPRSSPRASPRFGMSSSSSSSPKNSDHPNVNANAVTPRQVISEVYTYWVNKRSKLRKPLLRKYWPVTSANDTNPHLVFRPREKEKYKLRKKRTNDMEAYRKMRRLREDFVRVRTLMDLVVRRERLALLSVKLGCDLTDQRIYDCVDTSGLPRQCTRVDADSIKEALDIPRRFDTKPLDRTVAAGGGAGRRGKKRKRGSGVISPPPALSSVDGGVGGGGPSSGAVTEEQTDAAASGGGDGGGSEIAAPIVAGETDGFGPVPNFLEPLESRERSITSWNGQSQASFYPTYTNSHPEEHRQQTASIRYTRRPRVARGGRIVYDRIPITAASEGSSAPRQPPAVFTAGDGTSSTHNANSMPLFRLLPKPIDLELVSRRIEHICAEAVSDDEEGEGRARAGSITGQPSGAAAVEIGTGEAAVAEGEENDGEAILVKAEDWIATDDQLWGSERFASGPI